MLHTLLSLLVAAMVGVDDPAPMRIDCVDRATGRGVPLVSLRAVDSSRWISDSAGVVALREPDLEGLEVWFFVDSAGYTVPQDGFGNRGVRVTVRAGSIARIELDRDMIAERLYRSTGRGIWRDTVLCGSAPPVGTRTEPIPALITGLDSVQCVAFDDGLFWCFGDTNRPSYPLGHFATTAARCPLPGPLTFDPARTLPLDYFVGDSGFARGVARLPGPGAVWLDGLCALADESRMFAHFVRVKDLGTTYEQGLVEWNTEEQRFVKVLDLPVGSLRTPHGHVVGTRALRGYGSAEATWIYFGNPFPRVRVPARADAFLDPSTWQSFTFAEVANTTPSKDTWPSNDTSAERRWHWSDTDPPLSQFGSTDQATSQNPTDPWLPICDIVSGRALTLHAGSIEWNRHRQCYVVIANELGGEHSNLGDVWYAEADTPLGPWRYARNIAWHDETSFYNPFQHPWFETEDGRFLQFEGTFSKTFSRSASAVPLYDYNQLHYRVDTDDPRLALPRAVYRVRRDDGTTRWCTGAQVREENCAADIEDIAFFASPAGQAVDRVPLRSPTDEPGGTVWPSPFSKAMVQTLIDAFRDD